MTTNKDPYTKMLCADFRLFLFLSKDVACDLDGVKMNQFSNGPRKATSLWTLGGLLTGEHHAQEGVPVTDFR